MIDLPVKKRTTIGRRGCRHVKFNCRIRAFEAIFVMHFLHNTFYLSANKGKRGTVVQYYHYLLESFHQLFRIRLVLLMRRFIEVKNEIWFQRRSGQVKINENRREGEERKTYKHLETNGGKDNKI